MCAVSTVNAEDRPSQAMTRIFCTAERTFAAARIYLANNAFALKTASRGSFLHDTDEFVAKRSLKACVAFCDLKIRIANAGEQDADKSFVVPRRNRNFGNVYLPVCELQGLHL